MERLLTMDKEQFIAQMQADVKRILGQVADAVNDAPTGNLISGSEMAVSGGDGGTQTTGL